MYTVVRTTHTKLRLKENKQIQGLKDNVDKNQFPDYFLSYHLKELFINTYFITVLVTLEQPW
jgi:hypothetical protein